MSSFKYQFYVRYQITVTFYCFYPHKTIQKNNYPKSDNFLMIVARNSQQIPQFNVQPLKNL